MNDIFKETKPKERQQSGTNVWLYSTVGLIALIVIGGIAYTAYHLGQKSTTEMESSNTHSDTNPSTNRVGDNSNKPMSSNVPSVNGSTVSANIVSPSSGSGSITVNGEIFVVTNGRENIKLALVDVCALSEPAIQ
jgi:hypothetical protein